MLLERRNVAPFFLLAILVLMAYASFQIARVFLNYLLLAMFLGFLSHPMYVWLQRRIRSKGTSAAITSVAVTAIVVVPLTFLTIHLVTELSRIVQSLRVSTLRAEFDDLAARLYDFFGAQYDSNQEAGQLLLELILPKINQFAASTLEALPGALAGGIVGSFVLLYVLYYSYVDGERAVEVLRDIVPLQRAHADQLFREMGQVVKAVFYGTVLTASLQAVMAGIGFYLFGVPNVVFWTSITFVLALLPIIGPPLVWFPWGMVLLLQGDTFNGFGLLIYSAVMVSTLDNFIRPKLIGDRARVHPVVILVGVLGGVVVFGFSGFLLGPLTLAMFVSIVQLYRKEFATPRDRRLPLELEHE